MAKVKSDGQTWRQLRVQSIYIYMFCFYFVEIEQFCVTTQNGHGLIANPFLGRPSKGQTWVTKTAVFVNPVVTKLPTFQAKIIMSFLSCIVFQSLIDWKIHLHCESSVHLTINLIFWFMCCATFHIKTLLFWASVLRIDLPGVQQKWQTKTKLCSGF